MMKKKPVSIKSIAEHLKISVTTVSFVLNGKGKEKHISDLLIQKVLNYAKEVNYTPNQIAQSLRTGKSNILVFMVEDISNSFFSKLARIIEDIAYSKGYKVIFCSNENNDEKSIELIRLFKFRQVDGFIIVPSPGIKSVIQELLDENIPVVLLDRYFSDLDCNSVVVDNEQATYNAIQHLIDNHFKSIGFITTDSTQTQMTDRRGGYERAIAEAGLVSNVLVIPYVESSAGTSRDSIKKFIIEVENRDAVFFATNYLAQTGLKVLKKNAPHLINKLGMFTFDDNEFFKIHTPTISAVSQPMVEISTEVMKILLPLLQRKEANESPKRVVLQGKLKIRESSLAASN
ncbi:LacI family DNA-binding transcriptional regulator [Flavobacterium erciyesense]|jgi:LacI family transcriptional regulator|nr:LacI family DNA-binding transcriptional regulator [Flavobacterium erciyesense]